MTLNNLNVLPSASFLISSYRTSSIGKNSTSHTLGSRGRLPTTSTMLGLFKDKVIFIIGSLKKTGQTVFQGTKSIIFDVKLY